MTPRRTLEPYAFDTIYGAWWERIVPRTAPRRPASAERYARALRGELP